MPLLFIIFVIIPLTEIALFIAIGGQIGLWWTLSLTFVTALIGAFLVRSEGLQTIFSARARMRDNEIPLDALFHGICIAVAGALLITPGFLTDAIGFLLLTPPFRNKLQKMAARYFETMIFGTPPPGTKPHPRAQDDILEGDFERVDAEENTEDSLNNHER